MADSFVPDVAPCWRASASCLLLAPPAWEVVCWTCWRSPVSQFRMATRHTSLLLLGIFTKFHSNILSSLQFSTKGNSFFNKLWTWTVMTSKENQSRSAFVKILPSDMPHRSGRGFHRLSDCSRHQAGHYNGDLVNLKSFSLRLPSGRKAPCFLTPPCLHLFVFWG